jgi:hypothetical protein
MIINANEILHETPIETGLRGRAPAASPSLTPPSLLQTFGFQPFGALVRYVSKFSPI